MFVCFKKIIISELLKMHLELKSRNVQTCSGFISTHAVTTQEGIRGSHIVKPRVCVRLQLVWSNHCFIIVLVLGSSSTWSPHILEKNESRIKDHRTKDQGSVENESNKLNKLIGMIDCSSTWLSQDLPYAQAKIRENKRNRHKYNRYNKHKYTKYWKSHTTLKKCQFSPTDY